MKVTRFIDSILERHLLDNQNEQIENMQALIDYNIMMGNIEDPSEDEPEVSEGGEGAENESVGFETGEETTDDESENNVDEEGE